ncbi:MULTISPECIES: hypothetical protein [unclassified Sphingobacterium]|uniref:hypothetical protein n=1 Tax=unclassified Sphingobacterium TaxID=2609468 RepID=UPI0025E6593E|nr:MULTISPECIES: hypothetical protein [unclassified Sphingobacterium]
MKFFNVLLALCILIILVASCAKNQDSGNATAAAAGSFIGRIQYQDNSLEVDRDNRLIRVLKESNDTYKVEFFTGIPNITSLRLNQENDTTWVSADTTGLKNVKIEGKRLTINYQANSQSWVVENAVRN